MAEILENQLWGGGKGYDGSRLQSPTNANNGFDIFIAYGDYGNPAANHTTKKINNVHLTGQSQTIEVL